MQHYLLFKNTRGQVRLNKESSNDGLNTKSFSHGLRRESR